MNPHEHELNYPWPDVPALGAWTTLRPGVHWVRMPLPFALDHINLWVLDDEVEGRAGYTVVDSGISSDVTKQAWEQLFDSAEARFTKAGSYSMWPPALGMQNRAI